MSRSNSTPPHIDITRQKVGTSILVETAQAVWSFKIVDPENAIVEVYGTDQNFKNRPPVKGRFVRSFALNGNEGEMPHAIVKGWQFEVQFADAMLIVSEVVSARVEGDDWSYEVFA